MMLHKHYCFELMPRGMHAALG